MPLSPKPTFVPLLAAAATLISGCNSGTEPTNSKGSHSFNSSPCSQTTTLQLAVSTAARVDCSNGGTTLALAGNGASYVVVAQFPVDLVPDTFVRYRVSSGTAISASTTPLSSRFPGAGRGVQSRTWQLPVAGGARSPGTAQRRF